MVVLRFGIEVAIAIAIGTVTGIEVVIAIASRSMGNTLHGPSVRLEVRRPV